MGGGSKSDRRLAREERRRGKRERRAAAFATTPAPEWPRSTREPERVAKRQPEAIGRVVPAGTTRDPARQP